MKHQPLATSLRVHCVHAQTTFACLSGSAICTNQFQPPATLWTHQDTLRGFLFVSLLTLCGKKQFRPQSFHLSPRHCRDAADTVGHIYPESAFIRTIRGSNQTHSVHTGTHYERFAICILHFAIKTPRVCLASASGSPHLFSQHLKALRQCFTWKMLPKPQFHLASKNSCFPSRSSLLGVGVHICASRFFRVSGRGLDGKSRPGDVPPPSRARPAFVSALSRPLSRLTSAHSQLLTTLPRLSSPAVSPRRGDCRKTLR